jgi:hypothetical protein
MVCKLDDFSVFFHEKGDLKIPIEIKRNQSIN